MELLNIETTLNQHNFIKLNRDLTLDDVDIKDFANFPMSHNDNSNLTYQGASLALKESVISSLIKHTKVKIREDGVYSDPESTLGLLTDSYDSRLPARFETLSQETLSYRGLTTNEAKKELLDNKISKVKSRWESEKYAKISITLKEVQKALEVFLTDHFEKVNDVLKEAVVDQRVGNTWFENNLNDKDKKIVSENDSDVVNYQAEIDKLQKAINSKNYHTYSVKRTAIEKGIVSKYPGPQTKERLLDFLDLEKEPFADMEITF